MGSEALTESPLWEQFRKAARERRRNPERLLTDFMRDCLRMWQDQELDEAIRRDAQQSGCSEEDAVEIVRQYRQEKREGRILDALTLTPVTAIGDVLERALIEEKKGL